MLVFTFPHHLPLTFKSFLMTIGQALLVTEYPSVATSSTLGQSSFSRVLASSTWFHSVNRSWVQIVGRHIRWVYLSTRITSRTSRPNSGSSPLVQYHLSHISHSQSDLPCASQTPRHDYHFIRDEVAHHRLFVSFISTKDQLADVFTKPLIGNNINSCVKLQLNLKLSWTWDVSEHVSIQQLQPATNECV